MYRLLIALVCALFVIAFPYAQQPPFGQTALPPPPVELRPFSLAGGGTVSGPILFPDGSVSAPSISFTSDPDTGIYWPSSGRLVFTLNGTARAAINTAGYLLSSSNELGWASGSAATTDADVFFSRVSPNRLQLGNGSTLGRLDVTSLSGASIFTRTAVANVNYSVLASDMVIAVTSLNPAATITITLPSPTTADLGKVYIVKDESGLLTAGVNSIFISGTIKQVVGTQAMVGIYATSRYIAGGVTGSRSWFSW